MLEDVICCYRCVENITKNHRELNTQKAHEFFERCRIKLSLIIAYNLKENVKNKHSHPPIVKALIKTCNRKVRKWPRLLPFALWIDRIIHNLILGYISIELMTNLKPIMPIEKKVLT